MSTYPSTQTAYVVTQVGQPLHQSTVPVKQPTDHEITIQIYAFSINPADCKAQDNNPTKQALPYRYVILSQLIGTIFIRTKNY